MDKAERVGLQTRLLLHPDRLLQDLEVVLAAKRKRLGVKDDTLEVGYYEDFIREAAATLKPFIRDTEPVVEENLKDGKRFVLEGAHGTLLDLDHGTYPMVTASNSTTGGLLVGAGMPPLALTKVVGIFKAYQTKVGAGGMPTEMFGELADTIRERGQEYGTTTGRPRRIGWFDGVAARYAHRINGFTDIAITKVDTLADMGDLKLATKYTDGIDNPVEFQTENQLLVDCHAQYEDFAGWKAKDLKDVTTYDALPDSLKTYSEAIIDTMPGAKLSFLGVGRSRDQLIKL